MRERTISKIRLNDKERALLWASTAYNFSLTDRDSALECFIINRIAFNRGIKFEPHQYVMTNENLYVVEKDSRSEQIENQTNGYLVNFIPPRNNKEK